MSQIIKSSIIVSIFTILGMGLSFFSQMLIAAKFGAGKEMDTFFAATTIPLFIIGVFSGPLSLTLIPVFIEYSERNIEEINKIGCSFVNLNLFFTVTLSILGIIFANQLIRIITPGFSHEKIMQSVQLLKLLLPMIIFTVTNEILTCFYYSKQRFLIPSINKIVPPITIIIFILLFSSSMNINSVALAMLFAALIQMILLWICRLQTRDFKYYLTFEWKHPGVKKILKLSTPLFIGMLIYRAIPFFDRFFLSQLPEGRISHIGYAAQLFNFFNTLIISGITISLFPIMAQCVARKHWNDLNLIFSKGFKMLLFLSIPCVVLFGLHSRPFIELLWERGRFTTFDTVSVYNAFRVYIWALPAACMASLVGQGFYVLQDTKTPVFIGFIESILYVGLCYITLSKLQYLAIPVAFLIYVYFSLFVCGFVLRYKLGHQKDASLIFTVLNYLFAVTISLLFLNSIYSYFHSIFAKLVLVFLSFICYLLISRFVFKTEEVSYVFDLIFQTISKKISSNLKKE